jgi:hypothetical protein
MKKIAAALILSCFAFGSMAGVAVAQDTCQSKAIGKEGRPLAVPPSRAL